MARLQDTYISFPEALDLNIWISSLCYNHVELKVSLPKVKKTEQGLSSSALSRVVQQKDVGHTGTSASSAATGVHNTLPPALHHHHQMRH